MSDKHTNLGNLFHNEELEYESVVESHPDPICRFAPDGALRFVNQAFCDYADKTRPELLGCNYFSLVSKDRRTSIHRHIPNLEPNTSLTFLENVGQSPTGITQWRQWTDQGIFDHNVKLVEIQSSAHSFTGNVLAKPGIGSIDLILDGLNSAAAALASGLDFGKTFGAILDSAVSAISNAELAEIILISAEAVDVTIQLYNLAAEDPRIELYQQGENGYLSKAFQSQSPLRVDDIPEEFPADGLSSQQSIQNFRSAITAPLFVNNYFVGVLSLKAFERAAFTDDDLKLGNIFANTLSTAIRVSHLDAEVNRLATTDDITGLLNRKAFLEVGDLEFDRAVRYKRDLSILLLDIDNFKDHNNDLGRSAGDKILQYFARICKDSTRSVDIIGRIDADELVILLPETDLFAAAAVAERLREHFLVNPASIDDRFIKITPSVGVSKLMPGIKDLKSLIARAYIALNTAKDGGKNRVEIH